MLQTAAGPAPATYQRREHFQAAAFAATLLWVNGYICRDFFSAPTAYMNSMHGFWIALAKRRCANLKHGFRSLIG